MPRGIFDIILWMVDDWIMLSWQKLRTHSVNIALQSDPPGMCAYTYLIDI